MLPFCAQMEVRATRCRKVHFPMSHLVLFCSKLSKNQPPTSRFHRGSRGHFDRCLSEIGSLKGKTAERTGSLGAMPLACIPLNGGASGAISSAGTSSEGLELHFQLRQNSRSAAARVTGSLVEVLDKLESTTVYPVRPGQLHPPPRSLFLWGPIWEECVLPPSLPGG